ncbi:MAG: cell division protein FtsZ [Candidatus Calescibacterium sp.]|nr:cell division protein FtsZ [Candidatus Calescibacterium sp.]MDW8087651.1 cell division protein FtsZ [Candidatus Calescibacterium sp.]
MDNFNEFKPVIKVIGVGGGGSNIVNTLVDVGIEGVELIAVNTDAQVLAFNKAPVKIQIGTKTTRGLGAGGNPEVGRKSAEEDAEKIKQIIDGSDMVFVTAGMGGGTGTGAAPVIAQIAKEEVGALTVGVVTKPFFFEGKKRFENAIQGIESLKNYVDTLIVISNDKLFEVCGKNISIRESFRLIDSILVRAVKSISELITVPALINIDFADVRTIMQDKGYAIIGMGESDETTKEGRATKAAKMAIENPLLDGDIRVDGATDVLICISGGESLSLYEAKEAAESIRERISEDANIIFGVSIDESLGDKVRIIIVATGLNEKIRIQREEEKNMKSREEISSISKEGKDLYDIPSFLRRKRKII